MKNVSSSKVLCVCAWSGLGIVVSVLYYYVGEYGTRDMYVCKRAPVFCIRDESHSFFFVGRHFGICHDVLLRIRIPWMHTKTWDDIQS